MSDNYSDPNLQEYSTVQTPETGEKCQKEPNIDKGPCAELQAPKPPPATPPLVSPELVREPVPHHHLYQQQQRPSWPSPMVYPQTPAGIHQANKPSPTATQHSSSEQGQINRQSEGGMLQSETYHGMYNTGPGMVIHPGYYGPYPPLPHLYQHFPGYYQSPVPINSPPDPSFPRKQLQQRQQWQEQQQTQQRQQHHGQQCSGQKEIGAPGQGRQTPEYHQGTQRKTRATSGGQTAPTKQLGAASPVHPSAPLSHQKGTTSRSLPASEQEKSSGQGGPVTSGAARQKPAVSTVRVAGLDGTVDLELLQLYFEAPRKSGGGDIASLDDRRDEGFILIAFEDAVVAGRIVERHHVVSGKTLDVSLYDGPEEAADSALTIQVLGGPVVLDPDMMELYFSNSRKSGGGDIAKLEMVEKAKMALITFRDPSTAARVIGRHHTVSGQPLTVALYKKPPAAPETPTSRDTACTVKVTGGLVVLERDMMDLYFSNNRKSGGGDIANMEFLEEEEAAIITFTDCRVAKAVKDRKHIIGRTALTVENYIKTARDPVTQILVRGLVPRACDEDLLQLFFEKESGGDVTQVQLDASKGEAVIMFREACFVQRVMDKTNLKVGGGAVTVYTAPKTSRGPPTSTTAGSAPQQRAVAGSVKSSDQCCRVTKAQDSIPKAEGETPIDDDTRNTLRSSGDQVYAQPPKEELGEARSTTVCVRGLPMTTSQDYIINYFESVRRSGGGDVTEVVSNTEEGVFIVSFEDAEVAQRVLRREHTIDKHKVKLSIPSPHTQPEAPAHDDEVGPLTTVCVRGLPLTSSQDYLVNYFENSRRSGGGDVTDVKTDTKDGVFYVTFDHAEDAARVCGRKHKLDGRELSVALYKLPTMYTDRLLIKNIPEINSAAPLQMFVETCLDRAGLVDVELQNILFSDDEDSALVVFNRDVGDFGRIQEYFTQKPFQKCQLVLEQVPVSTTVIVCGLPAVPPVSAGMLQTYFANTQYSDGGDVVGVELLPDHLSALVTFADAGVAARVARKQHSIGKQPVKVSVYMECLGISGGHQELTVPLPPPLVLDNRDLQMLDRSLILPAGLEHLQHDLQKCYGRLELNKSAHTASVICMVSSKAQGAKQLVKVWADNVRQVLNIHWKAIHKHELTLTTEEFREVEGMVQEVVAGSNGNIGHRFNAEDRRLTLVCRGDQKDPRIEKLMSDLKQAQVGLERKKNEVTERIKQQSAILLMLQKHTDVKSLREKYPLLKINIFPDQGCVELRGLPEEIKEAKCKLANIFSKIYISEYTWESDLHKKLMRKDIAREMVLQKCLEVASNNVLVDLTSEGITAVSLDAERAEMVQTTARRLIQRRVIKFPDNAMPTVKSLAWEQAKAQILQEADNALVMQQDDKTLTIVSVHEKIQKYYERLKGFIREFSV